MAGGMNGKGVHGRVCVWQGVCVAGGHACGGMHGGVCLTGGMRDRGACVCGRSDGHCSGQYVSYWNAFLF